MKHEHSELLSELRFAIDEALWRSERIIAAIVALQQAGQGIHIAIDASLVDAWVPAAPAHIVAPSLQDCGDRLILSATDMRFLRTLKISVETGVAERNSARNGGEYWGR